MPIEEKEMVKAILTPAVYDLLNHLKEYSNVVSADLESGSHHLNNVASEQFAKKHPSQAVWAVEMATLIERIENQYNVYV